MLKRIPFNWCICSIKDSNLFVLWSIDTMLIYHVTTMKEWLKLLNLWLLSIDNWVYSRLVYQLYLCRTRVTSPILGLNINQRCYTWAACVLYGWNVNVPVATDGVGEGVETWLAPPNCQIFLYLCFSKIFCIQSYICAFLKYSAPNCQIFFYFCLFKIFCPQLSDILIILLIPNILI